MLKLFLIPVRLRFSVLPYLLSALLCCAGLQVHAAGGKDSSQWIATWGASPFAFLSFNNAAAPAPFQNQTVRQIVRISVGGKRLQVRFSNEIGAAPLHIGAATVAVVAKEALIRPETLHKITFGGADGITIPPGAPALSDAVDLPVAALTELAVSIYLPDTAEASTVHMGRTAFVSPAGNFTAAADLPGAVKSANQVYLTGIYVQAAKAPGVVVALGDSITDGAASTPYSYNSWPDHLAARLAGQGARYRQMAVINEGISGNQLLANGAGISTLSRFDRDVLATPGLTHIVVLIGINDIGISGRQFPGSTAPPAPMRTAEDLIAGYRQLIARAHAHTPPIKIYGATLTPFAGTFEGYYTPEKDKIREAVNRWIRASGEYDGFIDFDKAIQDPAHPDHMVPAYDSGDKLHPGDAGYKHIAESIDLGLFK